MGGRENPPRERLGAGDCSCLFLLYWSLERVPEGNGNRRSLRSPSGLLRLRLPCGKVEGEAWGRRTNKHAGIVCRRHQPNRAKGSREELPCRVQGQRPCWGQGAKPLGSSNSLVTRTAAGGIAVNPDKSAQGCRTLPIASCRLRQAAQSCNQTQGDGSHPHTQARRRQSAERTEAPSSGCASIPPAHSESAAQHPSSAHFRRAKPARTPPALGKQPEYSPAEGTARVETVGIRGSRTGAVLGTAQSPNPRHRTP